MNKHQITFNVVGSVTQEIDIIDDSYTMKDIVDGLNDGTLQTTIDFANSCKSYITKLPYAVVAVVTDQYADSTFTNIALEEN